jgi:hypothetical protein
MRSVTEAAGKRFASHLGHVAAVLLATWPMGTYQG